MDWSNHWDTPIKRDEASSEYPRKGYAAMPGSGPAGEKCEDCNWFAVMEWSKKYYRCYRCKQYWAMTKKTDIEPKSAACKFWEPKNA